MAEMNLVIMASVSLSLSRRYLEMTEMNPDIMAAVTARLEEQVRFQSQLSHFVKKYILHRLQVISSE